MGLIFNSRRAFYQYLAVRSSFALFRVALPQLLANWKSGKCISAIDQVDRSGGTLLDHTVEFFHKSVHSSFLQSPAFV